MSADELLVTCRQAGIVLSAAGDRLRYDAPRGALTPELRAALACHKPALLAALAPVAEYVTLQGGLIVPLRALLLALDLERREFRQSVDDAGQYHAEPAAGLTDADRA